MLMRGRALEGRPCEVPGADISVVPALGARLRDCRYSEEREQELRATARKEVLAALVAAEKEEMLPVTEMFEDVYDELPLHLREQKAEVEAHVRAHGGALSDNAGH